MRILLADDHDIVRHGLADMIARQPGWEVCAEARGGKEAVAQAAALKPDVAVVDMNMPDLDGLAVTREIRVASPATEILVFTMDDSEDLAAAVLAAGGRGYLLKSAAARLIVTAIRTVAAHRPFFPPGVTDEMRSVLEHAATHAAAPPLLSPREREVVKLLAEGGSRREIAQRLGIAERTVKAHQESAMQKTGERSVAGLTRYALRNRIIER
ncbi:response regulator [Falsiroseomonas sp. HW251]|uniref:response regulator n=1 Tax=Falsiroseomonas sp. HW251 TaxID=3390998 RepID=UPI003D3234FB